MFAAGCLTEYGAEAIWMALPTKLLAMVGDADKSPATTWSRSHRIAALPEACRVSTELLLARANLCILQMHKSTPRLHQ